MFFIYHRPCYNYNDINKTLNRKADIKNYKFLG